MHSLLGGRQQGANQSQLEPMLHDKGHQLTYAFACICFAAIRQLTMVHVCEITAVYIDQHLSCKQCQAV